MIPRLSHPLPSVPTLVERFLLELLARGFEGDITSEAADRVVFSTDNSIYQMLPQAIVFPRHRDDVQRIATIVHEVEFRSLVVTPRGGGTGTNGQSLTDGIVIDLSRYMNRILSIDPVERRVRVEAGVVKDQLNAALKPHGLFFAPELSTSNRATLGGMVNTDASGQGSCLYGKTRDYVRHLEMVLLGGAVWETRPLDMRAVELLLDLPEKVALIAKELWCIHQTYDQKITEIFPRLNRCLTGYDLAHLVDENGLLDLNAIFCGAEGTLGFVTEITLSVIPIPAYQSLVLVRYPDFDAALRDAPALMQLGAASIESMDAKVLHLARSDRLWSSIADLFPARENDSLVPTDTINIVEYVSHTEEAHQHMCSSIEQRLRLSSEVASFRMNHLWVHGDTVTSVWGLRKKAVGLLGKMPGEARPIPFVEDTAVPPEHLADFIRDFRAILDEAQLNYGMFGHVDAGVLHVRPAIDLKNADSLNTIRAITDKVVALVARYGGVLWGEHGKGFRSEYVPQVFGVLYPVLQHIKGLFDPFNQLNPGKIATPLSSKSHTVIRQPSLKKIDEISTRGEYDRIIPIHIRASAQEALHCNGNAACYNFDPHDVMCPSWKATRDRKHSPKGRASLMREWLRQLSVHGYDFAGWGHAKQAMASTHHFGQRIWHSLGAVVKQPDFSHEVKAVMDECLACKACAGQCPIQVDVPRFRSTFLYHYHQRYMRSMAPFLLSQLETVLPLLQPNSLLRTFYNTLVPSFLGQFVMKMVGLQHLPRLADQSLMKACANLAIPVATDACLHDFDHRYSADERAKVVAIVPDMMSAFLDQGVVLAFAQLLKKWGFIPWVVPYMPHGKALHVLGYLDEFEVTSRAHADYLAKFSKRGIDLVGIDPSFVLSYRSEYQHTHWATQSDAPQFHVFLPQEWLAGAIPRISWPSALEVSPKVYHLALHCTEKTALPMAFQQWQGIFSLLGYSLKSMNVGCCGMAGIYGHEVQHKETSARLYQDSWAMQLRHEDSACVLATGYSCRCQAAIQDQIQLKHPIQLLWECFS